MTPNFKFEFSRDKGYEIETYHFLEGEKGFWKTKSRIAERALIASSSVSFSLNKILNLA